MNNKFDTEPMTNKEVGILTSKSIFHVIFLCFFSIFFIVFLFYFLDFSIQNLLELNYKFEISNLYNIDFLIFFVLGSSTLYGLIVKFKKLSYDKKSRRVKIVKGMLNKKNSGFSLNTFNEQYTFIVKDFKFDVSYDVYNKFENLELIEARISIKSNIVFNIKGIN
jgi:hypothetical protein